jgi:5-carboxymethyl-2-hydroxymuconate isomerase
VAGARVGTLRATGRVIRRGRSVAFVQGEAHDAMGTLVATAQGTWHLWPHKPELEKPGREDFVAVDGTGERLRVGKIVAVGRNYAEHNVELGNAPLTPPVLFLKPPSALLHDGGIVTLPTGLGQVHHEVELVVVIGRTTRAVSDDAALDHVFGYAVGLDLTLRDLQNEAKKKGEPWDLAKGFDGSAPVSSVVPREKAGDVSALTLTLKVNGVRKQNGATGQMLHGVPALIAYASRWITLERGDLLFTGTPAGVGPLAAGDAVVAELSDLAVVRVSIA